MSCTFCGATENLNEVIVPEHCAKSFQCAKRCADQREAWRNLAIYLRNCQACTDSEQMAFEAEVTRLTGERF